MVLSVDSDNARMAFLIPRERITQRHAGAMNAGAIFALINRRYRCDGGIATIRAQGDVRLRQD
jgi:hypothetical protein